MAYKLTYFNVPGRGEPIRLVFAAAGVKFVDNQFTHEEWPEVKKAIGGGQVPLLQVGDKTLTQSMTICRYLARKFNLAGSDEWESAKCDELVDAVRDQYEAFVQFTYVEQDPVKKEEKKKPFLAEALPALLARLNKMQIENGGSFLIAKNITWADVVTVEILRQLIKNCDADSLIDGYPNVKKLQDAVNSNENIKAYRAKK